MDTPSQESGELTVAAGAAAFAALLEPESPESTPAVDTEVDPPKKEEESPEGEAETNAQEEGDSPPVTIKVDGKDVTLTAEQIAEAYKSGLRQEDYTKKTMAAADARRESEAATQKAQAERAIYAQNLTKMAAQLEGALQQQARIDWDALLASDPVEFLKQQHLSNQRQAALAQNMREQQALSEQFQKETAEHNQRTLQTQQQELLAKLPAWKDEAKAKTEREALKAYLKGEGYDDAAINSIQDHKAVILGRKAMLYDQMMAKAQAAAKKVSNIPARVERPGVSVERNALDKRTAAMQRLGKTGRVEDAAAVFASLL